MTPVPFVKLNSGISIPQIGLGVYELPDKEQCKSVVRDALAVGYRLIDSAQRPLDQFYQNERFVGEAIRESGLPREKVFVTTKVYQGFDNKEDLRANIQRSLDELGLSYIDLFLMHSPLCGKEQRISTWRFLNEIRQEQGEKGIIRAIGVSNFGVSHLRQLREAGLPAPSVNQIEAYCPLMRGPQSKQSLGDGADWAGMPGRGWDAPVLRDLAEKVRRPSS
ncbi:hypothetical protein QFC22_005739 [Naganishia vaughanmartiniae]|uniref:Uncharacterized protein n=1 Tax=Naganishia vaughanmartiniae TaxID=1424756 RepID=A0ACC2WUT6_9TREE|nr:hypothetical protein QFC22_005739 [Naganishia vaughanmartiniae]